MRLEEFCPVLLPPELPLPQEYFIGTGAIESLPELAKRDLGNQILCITDHDIWESFLRVGKSDLGLDSPPTIEILPSKPYGDMQTVAKVMKYAEGKSGIIAIGAGTLNDLGKYVATQFNLPYIIVGSAASMNGFASSIAALLDNKVKVTRPVRPPHAIVMDTNLLQTAPPEMARAGLGDLLSKPVCAADWWIGTQLEGGEFSELPGQIVNQGIEDVKQCTEGIGANDAEALEILARALVLSGISMVAAGSSRPASGGEHLISHLWDMESLSQNRELHLHGAQVGVATCICLQIYQEILHADKPEIPDLPSWEEEEKRIRREHGMFAESVLPYAKRKYDLAPHRRESLRQRWPQLREELSQREIPESRSIQQLLSQAKAPHRLTDLGREIDDTSRVIRLARDIRDRYTNLDLAYEIGLFPDTLKDVLIQTERNSISE